MKITLKIQRRDLQTMIFMSRIFASAIKGIELPGVKVYFRTYRGITAKAMESNVNEALIKLVKKSIDTAHKRPKDKTAISIDINTLRDWSAVNNTVETNTPEQLWFTEILSNALKSVA